MAPATGSMRMYNVEYRTAPTAAILRGRYGIDNHGGSGTAGVFVSCVGQPVPGTCSG